ncbi:MAG: EscU/YscU/HrcU family type III secretion system export apparatus switch protein [Desulfitobacteriaceae bacterium]
MSKRPKAAALKYDHQGVPKVVAQGSGYLAERLIEVAKQEGIPIQENPALVEALLQVQLNHEIPPKLFKAVAELLAFIWRLDEEVNKRSGHG